MELCAWIEVLLVVRESGSGLTVGRREFDLRKGGMRLGSLDEAVGCGSGRNWKEEAGVMGAASVIVDDMGRGEGSPLSAIVIGIILIGARGWSKSRRPGTAKILGLSNRFPSVESDDGKIVEDRRTKRIRSALERSQSRPTIRRHDTFWGE